MSDHRDGEPPESAAGFDSGDFLAPGGAMGGELFRELAVEADAQERLEEGGAVGPYRIASLLGRGALGWVYLAWDERLERRVVLKELRLLAPVEADLDAMLREARAASALHHPGIGAVYDLIEGQDCRFLVREYCEGTPLHEVLARGPLAAEACLELATTTARALSAAHHAGLVHQDIRPSNLVVSADGSAWVLDFGFGRYEVQAALAGLANSSHVAAPYWSPELRAGATVDARADLYALGAVLWEALAGSTAPAEADARVLTRLQPDVALGFVELVVELLRPSPEQRPESADLVLERLARLCDAGVMPARSLPRRLPRPLTGFFGRSRERREILALLEEARMVTLTGPGGIGKTRLALQVAEEWSGRPGREAAFVDLASILHPQLVASTIAEQLGVERPASTTALEALGAALGGRALLVLIDNFEQVASAGSLLTTLLESQPTLRLLVTSRVLLGVASEHAYPLPPLELPVGDEVALLDALPVFPGTALFLERARSVDPSFRLDGRDAVAVVQICRRLDGLPLAIELAAARVRLLPPAKLLERLDAGLEAVGAGGSDRPHRQRTLHDTTAWSFGLLSHDEQTLFANLSVFSGGSSLEMAEAVGGLGLAEGYDVLAGLQTLVDHSLLRRRGDGAALRFEMLATLREYARGVLAESEREQAVCREHARRFLDTAVVSARGMDGPEAPELMRGLALEHDNYRAALDWCEEAGERLMGIRLASALWVYWFAHGHVREGEDRLQRLLEGGGEPPAEPASGRALVGLGMLRLFQGRTEQARRTFESALGLFRQLGDRVGEGRALNLLAWAANDLGRLDQAEQLSREALELGRADAELNTQGDALNNLGWTSMFRGAYLKAREQHAQSLRLRREVGDVRGVAFSAGNLAWCEACMGELDRAERLAREALELLGDAGDKSLRAWAQVTLGTVAQLRGDYVQARELVGRSVGQLRSISSGAFTVWALDVLADVAIQLGEHDQARELLGESLAWAERAGQPWSVARALASQAHVMVREGELEAAERLLRRTLQMRRDMGAWGGAAASLEGLASVRAAAGRFEEAARLLGAAEALRADREAPRLVLRQMRVNETVRLVRHALGPGDYARAVAAGRKLWTVPTDDATPAPDTPVP